MNKRFWSLLLAVCMVLGSCPAMARSVRAAGSGTAILYAVDGDAETSIEQVVNDKVDSKSTLSTVTLRLRLDGKDLSFVKTGVGAYRLAKDTDADTTTDLVTGSDGCVRLTGLDETRDDYQLASAGDIDKGGTPEMYFVPGYLGEVTWKGTQLCGLQRYYTRQAKVMAVDGSGKGLNGAKYVLKDARDETDVSFVKLSDGVYRMARADEKGTTELLTGTVNKEDGVILIDGLIDRRITDEEGNKVDLILYGSFTSAPDGYAMKENSDYMWKTVMPQLDGDLSVRQIDLGKGTFDTYTNDTPNSANPAAQIGYGTWKVNTMASDEFNGTFLDLSRWHVDWDEAEVGQKNAQINKDGILEMQTIVKNGAPYGLQMQSKTPTGYGYYEARFRCPYVPSLDTFYLNTTHKGNDRNKEIDIVENTSSSKLNTAEDNLGYIWQINSHDWDALYPFQVGMDIDFEYGIRGTRERRVWYPGKNEKNSCSDDYYTYGCLYEPDKLTYYLNGKVVYVDQVQTAYRTFNLEDLKMQVVLDVQGFGYAVKDYTESEYNTDVRPDGSGLRNNTMYLDYFRYFERTDKTYTDVPYVYADDGDPSAVKKEPQASLTDKYSYNNALSDEFNDGTLDMDFSDHDFINGQKTGLWNRVHDTVNEHGSTLRVPVEVYDPYAAAHKEDPTDIQFYMDVIGRNSSDYTWGNISTKVQDDDKYGDGYYEFRGKASQCDHKSTFTLSGSKGSMAVELFGDPIVYTEWTDMVRMSGELGGDATEQLIAHTNGKTAEAYHIYGVLVKGSTFTLYIDGEKAGSLNAASELGSDIKVAFSTEGDTSNTGETVSRLQDGRDTNFYVDYLRYYEQTGTKTVVGDINGDGLLTVSDITIAAYYLRHPAESTKEIVAKVDADGNGVLTVSDLAILAYYLRHGI